MKRPIFLFKQLFPLPGCVVAVKMLLTDVLMKWHHRLIDMHILHTHTRARTCLANVTIQSTYRRNISGSQQQNREKFGKGHTLVGRVCRYIDLTECVPGSAVSWSRPFYMNSGRLALIFGAPRPSSSSFWGSSLQALTFFGGARFIAWRLRRLFLGECRLGPRHFWNCCAFLGYGPAPDPPKKALCYTHPVGRTNDKYGQ